jgi:DNA repair exonuclease SbcCD ATPase subunit
MNLFESEPFAQIPGQMAFDTDAPSEPKTIVPRMTYREKRERKAERLRDWADRREANQSALNEAARADEAATGIPFGQPILVGHHSEGRHRRAIEKIDRAMHAAVDNGRTAANMSSRADEIERQLDTAIYDDDPDAIERLRGKLERLEAKRERMKAANAAYRKEHRDELKTMSAYGRNQAVPFPSYSISNIGGVITSTRQRIERLSRPVTADRGRWLESRYEGECRKCGAATAKGDRVLYFKRDRAVECEACQS